MPFPSRMASSKVAEVVGFRWRRLRLPVPGRKERFREDLFFRVEPLCKGRFSSGPPLLDASINCSLEGRLIAFFNLSC